MFALTISVTASGALRAQDRSPIELAGRDIALELADVVQCTPDRSARVGVWPFDPGAIPIPADNAKVAYETFLRGLSLVSTCGTSELISDWRVSGSS